MTKKRKAKKKRWERAVAYRGYLLEKRGKGSPDVDVFAISTKGTKHYQASGVDLAEGKHIVDLLRGD